jgi:hypothetical protein
MQVASVEKMKRKFSSHEKKSSKRLSRHLIGFSGMKENFQDLCLRKKCANEIKERKITSCEREKLVKN